MKNLLRLTVCAACVLTAFSCDIYAAKVNKAVTVAETPVVQETRTLDRIVAVVNRDVITEYELQNRVHQVAMNLRRQNIQLPEMPILRRQVLDRLISEKATNQRAQEIGLRVDEQMVTASIEQIAHNNRMTPEELRERLAKDGVTYGAFRSQIREEILLQRLREREVDSKITIPESEIDTYLAEQAGFSGDETTEYHVAHIVVPIANGKASEAESLAKDIVKQAKKGADFGKLAATYSKGDDALEGGDLGWRDAGRLPTSFWQAIQNNTKRGFVTYVKVGDSYHVLKVLGERNGVKAKLAGAPVEQTHARHILMVPSEIMTEAQIISRLTEIRHKIVDEKGDFATFARLNSVDNSATRGGDIGWVHPGDTVPEFENAMSLLKPGEVSDIVKSKFGYHLIQVLERRKQVADEQRARYAARQALREKKLAEAVNNWQNELRDKAYVEIREENL